jgi:hypothetical protein
VYTTGKEQVLAPAVTLYVDVVAVAGVPLAVNVTDIEPVVSVPEPEKVTPLAALVVKL